MQNNSARKQAEEMLDIKDLFYLVLSRWYWVALSLLVTLSVAMLYILTTPPTYTRVASILIKETSKGKSLPSEAESFSDFSLLQATTNVSNELLSLQSPAVMLEVVKRLHLETSYHIDGNFYEKVAYGPMLPVTVRIADFPENESATFTIRLHGEGGVELSDFSRNGEPMSEGKVLRGMLSDTINSPLGKMVIEPSLFYGEKSASQTFYVSRSSLHAVAEQFAARLTVSLSDEKSSIINLSFQDTSIQRAEDILSTLIAVYNENWMNDKNQIAISTSAFIGDRLNAIEMDLGGVDEDISSYKSKNLLSDIQAASSMYMQQNSEVDAQILALNNQLYMTRYIRNYLTNESNKNQLLPMNSGIESSTVENEIKEYNAKLLQRNSLVANSSAQNPLVIDIDQALVAMRKVIIGTIENQLVTLNAQINTLKQSERQTTARIAANPTQAKYLLSFERQQKVKESLYLFLLQKREENELSQAFTAYNTRVITPPGGKMFPTAPLKNKILLIAFALGLLIPIVLIFIRESTSTTIRGRKDLESITVPFIGEIPLLVRKKKRWAFWEKRPGMKGIVVKAGRRDVINEAFRVLRTNLEFIVNKEGKSNVILLTSFNPGSGKTFLTMNIAMSLAIKNKRVLVIDGDLRHATTSSYIASPQKGLSDYLGRRVDNLDDIIVSDTYENLHVLPVGMLPPNPTELLEEARFGGLIEQLRDKYDYIFIDCPPIEIVADTQIIEKIADRTIFVVCVGLLERRMLTELENIYNEKKFKSMSMILNGAIGGGRYGYKYGYRYGYHDGTNGKSEGSDWVVAK